MIDGTIEREHEGGYYSCERDNGGAVERLVGHVCSHS